jgi:hypothetical protein
MVSEEMERYLRDKHEKNRVAIEKNKGDGAFLTPYKEGDAVINGTVLSKEAIEGIKKGKYGFEPNIKSFNNRLFEDPMIYEDMEEGGLTFGGKKVRRNTKNTKNKRWGRIKRQVQKTRRCQKTRRGKKNKVKKTRRV